jgi:precorrin-4/cobalt-precorrin-4 C11-methyltransferase
MELKVYIIGVGPGDPELLTVKAHRLIGGADAIFYADSLIPPELLTIAKSDAEIIPTSSLTLEQIVPMMIDRFDRGKTVARLHSGDLTLYSAISEQIYALQAAQIPIELIPGVGVFQAAAAKLQVELTIPELVQTIILTRTSGRASSVPPAEELATLAAHQASLVLYLSARHARRAQSQLLAHYPADTPVAICDRVSWADERIQVVPLSMMADVTERENLVKTTLYIISPALTASGETRSRLYHPQHSHLYRP